MVSATASVAQLAEHRSRFAWSWVRFPARWPKLGLKKSRYMGARYFLHQYLSTYHKHSKECAKMFLSLSLYIYIYIYMNVYIKTKIGYDGCVGVRE